MRSFKKYFALIIVLFLSSIIFSDTTQIEFESNPERGPIVIYGDTRSNHEIHRSVVATIESVNPSVVFHTGDIARGSSTEEEQYEIFREITMNLRNSSEFFPVKGNHEVNSECFIETFPFMEAQAWYSVDRNDIHFIVLDSTTDIIGGEEPSEQYLWLLHDLENIRGDILFTVVIFHHPIFTTGPHPQDEQNLGETLLPVFSDYGIDIVFTGHNHSYEKSLYNGIYHIVAAGGGATLYEQMRESRYSQLFLLEHHFCRLTVQDDQLIVDVLNTELQNLDQIVISNEE